MKFGIAVTTSVTPAVTGESQAEYVRVIAEVVEESGYDSVWVSDRTLFPSDLAERYPDQFGPGKANPEAQNVLEAMTTLSYVAGATKKVRLGMSVLVLPFRNPLLNAKMVTTLDVLSGGRVTFGIGAGWMPEEFASMGASFDDRGAVTDEHIEIFRACCSSDVPEYKGNHFQTSGMVFFPRPIQQPHPPIWVGGNANASLRRAAKYGNAWHGIRQTPESIGSVKAKLAEYCEQFGRSSDDVAITLRQTMQIGEAQKDEYGNRVVLTGSISEIADDCQQFAEAGVGHILLSIAAPSLESTEDAIRLFASEVLPKFN